MSGRIYLLNEKSDLMAMEEAPYDSEKLLQEMLAKHPDLLAGEQINSDEPRRWLLVTREMAVPFEVLTTDDALEKLKAAVSWLIEQVKAEGRYPPRILAAYGHLPHRANRLAPMNQRPRLCH